MVGRSKGVKENFIYNSIYQIIAIAIPLITTPYLSRILGVEGIGEYAYAYSIAYYFTLIIKLGLNNYGSREIAYYREDKMQISKIFWELYFFQAMSLIVLLIIYVIYSMQIAQHKEISLILSLFVVSSGIDITRFFWGMEEFKLIVLRDLCIKTLSTIGIFAFVKTEEDTWKYALLLCIGFLGSQLLLWPSLKKSIRWCRPTVKGIVHHIKPNLLLFLPTIAVSLYKTMDKIMLGFFSSTVEVGYYESSEKIIQVPMALITSLGTVMQPRMTNLLAKGEERNKLNSILDTSFQLAVFLSSIIGFGIMAVAKEFVPWFYGEGYEKCINLYEILLPSCLFLAFANVIRTQYLIPNRKDVQYIISLFAGAIINLIINMLLVVKYQAVGVAIGTLAAEITVCVVQTMFVRKDINIPRNIQNCAVYIIAGISMYLVCTGINLSVKKPWDIFIKAGIGAAIYGSILCLALWIRNRIREGKKI